MKYRIQIDHESRIIRYRHSGIIFPEDIENAWSEFLSLKEFTVLKYHLLSDYREGHFQMSFRELPNVIDFMRPIENVVRGKKQALIVDNPHGVAGSILFIDDVYREVGFIVKVFSTESAALNWLTQPI